MPTAPSTFQPRRSSVWAFVAMFVLLATWVAGAITSQAVAASTTHCSGPVSSHSGNFVYKVTNLTVANTTCAVGKKLSSKIPASRAPKPIKVEGFRCTSTLQYTHPEIPVAGGSENYVCRKSRKLVSWSLEIPAED